MVLIIIITLLIFLDINSSYSENSTSPKKNNNTLQSSGSNTETIADRGVLLNPERLQIILRNDTSKNSDNGQQTFSLITNIITAVSAVGGAALGSLLTSKHLMNLEKQKISTQRKEEEDFNSRIAELVESELTAFKNLITSLEEGESKEEDIRTYKTYYKSILGRQVYLAEYTKLSLERRARVFTPETLAEVEKAYQLCSMFSTIFQEEFQRYLDKEITIEQLRDTLGIKGATPIIDDAIKAVRKQLKKD